ncbi:peptidoglycan-binding protein [Actinoplanes sp. GCM10030250]|uniref:peptidoglycan-binding protein n=1 Tax=Actinoplanes sp. GCM10030250 TaxID=3273376 RepID=UPI00360EFDBE
MNRRGRALALIAAGAALVSVGGVAGAAFVKSPAQQRAEAQPPDRTALTSPVEKRVLASTVVVRGQVGSVRQVQMTPVSAQRASALVVTAVKTRAGATVRPGKMLLCVSGRPLIALQGKVPAYRDLRPGDEGEDVAQLQAALRKLEFYGGGDDKGHFGAATKRAVEKLYDRAGFAPATTAGDDGADEREALRAAQDAVTSAQEAVAARPTAQAKRALQRARQDLADLVAETGPMVPSSEVLFLPAFPATVSKLGAGLGDPVKEPLITVATGDLAVTAKVPPQDAEALREGMAVGLTAESLGADAEGVISAIGEVTAKPDDESAAPFVPITVKPAKALASTWHGLDVRVTVTAARSEGEVLVVPLSAVSAAADGSTVVTVADGDGAQRRVEVDAGISGDGFVEVAPVNGQLEPGDQVVLSQ